VLLRDSRNTLERVDAPEATINVVAGIGGEEVGKAMALDESCYDLRTETNEFLTELARGLSEENENLGGLVRGTVETLKALSGWEKDGQQEGGMVVQLDAGYENIAAEMDGVIDHLRTLLTNPSFVPLEEVEVREDEIQRLREGWEKMEARWREAVQMMDGWRKRMAKSGQTVNLEELRMGISLSPLKAAGPEEISNDQESDDIDEGDTQADIDAMDDSQVPITDPTPELDEMSSDDSSLFEEDIEEEPQREAEEVQDATFNTTASSLPGTPPQLSPLRDTINASNRRNAFTTIIEENTWDLAHLDQSSSNIENTVPASEEVSFLKPSPAEVSPRKSSTSSAIKPSGSSRLPRPASAAAQQSPLTMASIAAKLAATEREADAARVRAKLKAAKLSSAATAAATTLRPPMQREEDREPIKENAPVTTMTVPTATEDGPSRKRKATSRSHGGKVSRRRSTLSPWELESLMLGAPGTTPAKSGRD